MSSRKINFNQKIENVRMLDRYNPRKVCMGTLFVTSTHVAFTETDPNSKKETWILLWHISSFEKLPLTTIGCPLQIRTKNFRSVIFVIQRERDCHEIYTVLQQICQPAHVEDLYCFRYTSSDDEIPKSAGWTFFDVQAEFQRMRVPNERWSICHLNKNYELCDTYPSTLFVPSHASSQVLIGSSKFRSKGRLPVLTYLHSNKAAICRCSQPLSGFNARCYKDEEMLDCIVKANPAASYMVVVDTRPKINAMANRATGKGYENENFYENIKFNFCGIENIHVMRNSLAKLIETCEIKSPTMSSFLNGLESSGWLKHIKSILDTSWFIAETIMSGVSVLVHCSDGWDRTAQVCSLASILLDPFYRTVHGFQALIEKDWLSFGHKFMDRVGFLAVDSKEISPVFTQFIECIWQLISQFPAAFQFNEQFLFTIHDHCCSCRFGTFIGNNEKQRIELRLSERTFSLWGYMANHTNEYINPLYQPNLYPEVIKPHLIPQNIKGMYCRFESGVQPRETVFEAIAVSTDHCNSLDEHIKYLQKKIAATKALIDAKNSKKTEDFPVNIGKTLNSFFKKESFKLNYVEDPLRVGTCPVFSKEPTKEPKNSVDALGDDLTALAIDWKTLRNAKECAMKDCSASFDNCTRKFHCWQCGDLFCNRCIARHTILPGHHSHCAVPVCKFCYAKLNRCSTDNI